MTHSGQRLYPDFSSKAKGWDTRPARFFLKERSVSVGKDWDKTQLLSLTKQGVIDRDIDSGFGKYPASFEGYQLVEPGNLVFCLFDVEETPRTVGLVKNRGMITSAYTAYQVNESVADPRFLEYLFVSVDNGKLYRPFYSGLRNTIPKGALLGTMLSLPPVEEQKAIADYLDRELDELDKLSQTQERLISLISLRRKALIQNAVTKGLDATVRLVHTGHFWLGDVPGHWRQGSLKRFVQTGAGAGFPIEFQGREDLEIPFLKVNALAKANAEGVISIREDTVSHEIARQLGAKIYPAGSIVMAKIGAALLLGRVRTIESPSCIDNNLMAIFPRHGVVPRFLYYLLHVIPFALIVNPGAVPSTSEGAISRIPVALPPQFEQVQIAEFLDNQLIQLDRLEHATLKAIALINERKAALISAAVTGKIHLRGKN